MDTNGGTYEMRMSIKTPVQDLRIAVSFETLNDDSARKIVDHLIDSLKPSVIVLGSLTCLGPRIVELSED